MKGYKEVEPCYVVGDTTVHRGGCGLCPPEPLNRQPVFDGNWSCGSFTHYHASKTSAQACIDDTQEGPRPIPLTDFIVTIERLLECNLECECGGGQSPTDKYSDTAHADNCPVVMAEELLRKVGALK